MPSAPRFSGRALRLLRHPGLGGPLPAFARFAGGRAWSVALAQRGAAVAPASSVLPRCTFERGLAQAPSVLWASPGSEGRSPAPGPQPGEAEKPLEKQGADPSGAPDQQSQRPTSEQPTAEAGQPDPGTSPPAGQGPELRPPKGSPRQVVVDITPGHFSALATLPVRHLLRALQLRFVAYFVPIGWDWGEFREGAAGAIRAVHGLLAAGDFGGLQGLVSADLLSRLRQDQENGAEEGWRNPPTVRDVRPWGIYSCGLVSSEGSHVMSVTILFLMEEEYAFLGTDQVFLVRRLQRWTFDQQVGSDQGWQVSNIQRRWYWRRRGLGNFGGR